MLNAQATSTPRATAKPALPRRNISSAAAKMSGNNSEENITSTLCVE
jgi:hypothetical protein